ncbi:hypothetical protein [Vasconcelosia minhoensis]|uniref:hypothetical protein n=1 Tax=Vasconcelosia minhoensis TaxID=3366354 RepID=UPI001D13C7F7|nr:hypothetical protein [Romeria gracilis]
MSIQITITLSDEVYQRAEQFARLSNRDIASILADMIQRSIPPVRADIINLESVSALSDVKLLALAELQVEPDQDARLSELLARQQAGCLAEDERLELQALMQIYQEGLLQKATALSKAVMRDSVKLPSEEGSAVKDVSPLAEAAQDRFKQHAGAISLGYATGLDNEGIDADLARAYADDY